MSLQNLLEMEQLPKRKPKPIPRSRRAPRLGATSQTSNYSSAEKRERDIDDVISMSSSPEPNNGNNSSSVKQGKRTVAFTTTITSNSFDNDAFIPDNDDVEGGESDASASDKSAHSNRQPPQPLQRRKDYSKNSNKSNSFLESPTKKSPKSLGAAWGDEESQSGSINENDDEDGQSDATFTIANETGSSNTLRHLTGKPPIPKPKRKGASNASAADLPPKPKTPIPKIKRRSRDHLAVDIEPEVEEHNENDDGKNSIKDDHDEQTTPAAAEATESADAETASVTYSAAAAVATKQSVKSRFGKLFNKSSSTSKDSKIKSKKNSSEKIDQSENISDAKGGSESVNSTKKSGSKMVSRWKKTFSRSTSKPLPEEEDEESHQGEEKEEEGDDVEEHDDDKSSKSKPEVVPESSKKKAKNSKDTQILFTPEVHSNLNSEDDEQDERDEPDEDDRPLKLDTSGKVMKPEMHASEDEEELEVKMKSDVRRPSKFKPLAKLVTSKSKEKSKPEPKLGKQKKTSSATILKQRQVDDDDRFSNSGSSSDSDSVALSEKENHGERETGATTSEPTTAKSSPKRKRRKSIQDKQADVAPPMTDSVSGRDLLFGVTVHCSDLLPLDPNVIHPVIKVTAMYQNGKFMRRTKNRGAKKSPTKNKSRHGHKSSKSSKRRSEDTQGKEEEEEDDDDENDDGKTVATSNLAKSVLPIMSQPCQARQSIPTFAPTWNELLVFEEPFKRFAKTQPEVVDQQPILFFEVMDFLPMSSSTGNGVSFAPGYHGSDPGWYKVAWAFLKPIGANGVRNLNRKLRLQLYKPMKLRGRDKKQIPTGSGIPEVYSWWKTGSREKINSTLFVTPKGILPPETKTASLRQLLSMRKEQLTQAILDSQLAPTKAGSKRGQEKKSSHHLYELPNWTRMEGQSCKPPNKLVASLPSSQIESLNIVISGNVYCTKFSPCGNILAAALDTDELHVILLFRVPSWTLLKTLKGHHGIIYDLTWKFFQLDDDNFYHYFASASADCTARIWKMGNGDEKSLALVKVLHHPSYVYSVRFHPTHPSCLVATACFDWAIRIWHIKADEDTPKSGRRNKHERRNSGTAGILRSGSNSNTNNNEASPIVLLDKHNNYVNCLLFDAGGQHLFSGDGSSCIFKWSCVSPSKKNSWRLDKDVKLHHANVSVNCLNLHPSGNRLLVHLRDNFLKILDVVTLIPLQSFSGLHNERLQIRSCFSPCGNLVLSGSEDSTLCIWDADTGKILQLTSPKNHPPNCIVACVDYHPFDYYIAVGLASTISEPSPVLVYFYDQPSISNKSLQINYYPMLKKTALKFRQSIEKTGSRSRSQSVEDTQEGGDLSSANRSTKRVDSSEKFISIIQKLDTALYFAQQRNKKRQSEATSSSCLASTVQSNTTNCTANTTTTTTTTHHDVSNPENNSEETFKSTSKYAKKQKSPVERPRSASVIARGKKEQFRKSHDTKSDSEQSYQFKVTQVEEKLAVEMQVLHHSSGKPPKPLKRRSISHSIEDVQKITIN